MHVNNLIYFLEMDVNYNVAGDPREFFTYLCRTKLPALQTCVGVSIRRIGKDLIWHKFQIVFRQQFFTYLIICDMKISITCQDNHFNSNYCFPVFTVECDLCKVIHQNDAQHELFITVPAQINSLQEGLERYFGNTTSDFFNCTRYL